MRLGERKLSETVSSGCRRRGFKRCFFTTCITHTATVNTRYARDQVNTVNVAILDYICNFIHRMVTIK